MGDAIDRLEVKLTKTVRVPRHNRRNPVTGKIEDVETYTYQRRDRAGGALNTLKGLFGGNKRAKQAEALRAHQANYDRIWAAEQNWLPDDNGNVTDHTKRTMPDSRRAAEALGEHAMGGSSGKVAALRGGLAYAATRAGQRLLQQQDSDLASLPHPWAPSDDRTYRSDIGSVTRMANGQWAARHKDYPAALGRFPTPLKAAQAVEKRHRRK